MQHAEIRLANRSCRSVHVFGDLEIREPSLLMDRNHLLILREQVERLGEENGMFNRTRISMARRQSRSGVAARDRRLQSAPFPPKASGSWRLKKVALF